MNANEKQIAGDHYKSMPIQAWDFILENKLGYMEGNIIKYISRWQRKNGVADLEKAKHYLEKLIESFAPKTVTIDATAPVKIKRGRGRPRKAPYGYRADGKPYKNPPAGWQGEVK